MFGVKTVTLSSKRQIAIPSDINIAGFHEGDKIAVITFNDRIELRPLDKLKKIPLTAIASEDVLGKEWNTKEEDEAWKDL